MVTLPQRIHPCAICIQEQIAIAIELAGTGTAWDEILSKHPITTIQIK
jgi:hypothetical protein